MESWRGCCLVGQGNALGFLFPTCWDSHHCRWLCSFTTQMIQSAEGYMYFKIFPSSGCSVSLFVEQISRSSLARKVCQCFSAQKKVALDILADLLDLCEHPSVAATCLYNICITALRVAVGKQPANNPVPEPENMG